MEAPLPSAGLRTARLLLRGAMNPAAGFTDGIDIEHDDLAARVESTQEATRFLIGFGVAELRARDACAVGLNEWASLRPESRLHVPLIDATEAPLPRRLALTYRDLASNPRYGKATAFFLGDLYGTKDFSHRDESLLRIGLL